MGPLGPSGSEAVASDINFGYHIDYVTDMRTLATRSIAYLSAGNLEYYHNNCFRSSNGSTPLTILH